MNLQELSDHLDELGFPLAYHHFDSPQKLPYMVYLFKGGRDLKADDMNFIEISDIDIELYTDKKDLVSEKLVEDKLKDLKLPYRKYEVYIEKEKMYQVAYEIQII